MTSGTSMSGVVKRFRTMAILAGIMSLLLWFVDLPVAYLFDNESWKAKVDLDSLYPRLGLCRICIDRNSICEQS